MNTKHSHQSTDTPSLLFSSFVFESECFLKYLSDYQNKVAWRVYLLAHRGQVQTGHSGKQWAHNLVIWDSLHSVVLRSLKYCNTFISCTMFLKDLKLNLHQRKNCTNHGYWLGWISENCCGKLWQVYRLGDLQCRCIQWSTFYVQEP